MGRPARFRPGPRARRWIFWSAAVALCAALSGALTGVALARATPAWWRPISRADPALESLARRVENAVMSVASQNRPSREEGGLWRSDPWSIRLSEEEASAWLTLRLPLWLANQDATFKWPGEVGDVRILFGDGAITVGAWVERAGGSVIAASVAPRLDAQGRLYIPASRVAVGRLAVPASWVLDGGAGVGAYIPDPVKRRPEAALMLRALAGEALVERALVKLGDGRRIRIVGFTSGDGMLEVTCRTERPAHAPAPGGRTVSAHPAQ